MRRQWLSPYDPGWGEDLYTEDTSSYVTLVILANRNLTISLVTAIGVSG